MPGLLSQTSNVLASILGAVRDPQFRADVRQGLLDAGNRGAVAGLLGGPVDLAAMALKPLGYAVDKPVMGSEWIGQKMQDAGLVSGNRNALAEGLASIALPAAAPMLGRGVYAAEQAAARNAMAPTPFNSGTRGQGGAIVWQGSPHKYDPEKLVRLADGTTAYVGGKFNALKEIPPGAQVLQDFPLGRIRSEAIGTGEGAQAYGHGLYLAENPAVATEYRRTLSAGVPEVIINGRRIAGTPFNSAANQLALSRDTITRDDLAGYLLQRIQELSASTDPLARAGLAEAKKAKAALDKAKDVAINYDGSAGYLYKVDLPDNAIARMLNWDLPLGQQAPEVQKALSKFPANMRGQDAYSALSYGVPPAGFDDAGRALFDGMAALQGRNPVRAVEKLRSQGIPGIRYLDGGSRGAGTGTSNYVVFPGEESILNILERNGVPVR